MALSGEHSQTERNQALQALRDRRARVCVATDVAARGIDLPTLSLVVHVELPRDAETLQHRSGRTGRAGKKGTAVLIVPYPRRKRVESMLRGAQDRGRVDRRRRPPRRSARSDRERLLAALLAPVEIDEEDRELAARLLAERSARGHRRRAGPRAPRGDAAARGADREHARGAPGRPRRSATAPGFEDMVWFRMDIGRRQNADPRWILPLLCRRGHITRNEIGAIRIGPNETHFQVPRAIAGKFAGALARTAGDGGRRRRADRALARSAARRRAPASQGVRPSRRRTRARATDRRGVRDRATTPSRGRIARTATAKKAWPKKPHRKGPKPG